MTTIINGSSPSITFSDGSAQTSATRPFQNRIINGAMMIDQRNAGASVTIPAATNTYTLDRWIGYGTLASKYTVQQNAASVTPPVGFSNYLGATSSAATAVGTSDEYDLIQKIEGFNAADLGFGTASAKTITLSALVRSSLTGTFGGILANSALNRVYPFTYSIPVANTWTAISVTIAGDTSGTWLTTNGTGLYVSFCLGAGATVSGTAGAWGSTYYASATGAVQVVATNGATFYITGVQLEVGSTATSFDYRPFGTEFDLCRRYFEIIRYSNSGGNYYVGAGVGMAFASNDVRIMLQYYPKRASATCVMSGSIKFENSSTSTTLTSYLFDGSGANTALMYNNSTGGVTLGQTYQVLTTNTTTNISFSAEL